MKCMNLNEWDPCMDRKKTVMLNKREYIGQMKAQNRKMEAEGRV